MVNISGKGKVPETIELKNFSFKSKDLVYRIMQETSGKCSINEFDKAEDYKMEYERIEELICHLGASGSPVIGSIIFSALANYLKERYECRYPKEN